jgi:hypothetical protein
LKKINSLASSEGVSNVILGLIFIFPILPFNIVSILVITLVIAIILEKVISKDLVNKDYSNLIYTSVFYFILIITLSYSDNFTEGLKEVQKSLPIFLFTLIFFFKKESSRSSIKIYLLIFIFANFAFIIFLYRYFFTNFFLGCHYDMSLLPNYIKIRYLFNRPFFELMWCSEKVGESFLFVHKVYNSMFLLFCNASIIYLLRQFKFRNWMKAVLVVMFILFSSIIINMVSVVNLFLFFIFSPIVLFLLSKQISRKFQIAFLFFFALLIIATIYIKKDSFQFIKKEMEWISNTETNNIENGFNTIDILQSRYYVNICSIDIIKQNPIFGVGVGDAMDFQINCYLEKRKDNLIFSELFEQKLNHHNQYITYLSGGGLILLLAFFVMLLQNLKKEYLRKNYLYVFFLTLIICNLFFESMFTRMYGVLFFSLFSSLLKGNYIILRNND